MMRVKPRDAAMFIIINLFMGFMWVLFSEHVLITSDYSRFMRLCIFLFGGLLFGEVYRGIIKLNKLKRTHPVTIVGFITFFAVVLVHLFVWDLT